MENTNILAPILIATTLALLFGIVLTFLNLFVKKTPKKENTTMPETDKMTTAVILCSGVSNVAPEESEYQGYQSCMAAKRVFGGPKACKYGCIGLGDCVQACPQNAISICNGLAKIDKEKCNGCGICLEICPQDIIRIYPRSQRVVAACNSKDSPEIRSDFCKVACTACGKCVETCPFKAIQIKVGIAKIDPNKCVSCGKCAEVCPQNLIHINK